MRDPRQRIEEFLLYHESGEAGGRKETKKPGTMEKKNT